MPTFLDYAKVYGQKSFTEQVLNSIDLAIFNELGYLPLGQGQALVQPISLQELKEDFLAAVRRSPIPSPLPRSALPYWKRFWQHRATKESAWLPISMMLIRNSRSSLRLW